MDTLSLLPFLVVTACFAVPSIRGATVPNSALPALPAGFTRQTAAPVFVALVTGFYEYACSQGGTWEFSESSGSVFDISGLSGSAEFTNIQFDAFKDMSNSHSPDPFDPSFSSRVESKYGIKPLGEYTDTNGNPTVDFSSSGGGSVVTDVTVDATSPSGPSSVDWMELAAKTGSLAHTVLLIGTVGGLPPDDNNCEPGTPPATSQFCSQLWGF